MEAEKDTLCLGKTLYEPLPASLGGLVADNNGEEKTREKLDTWLETVLPASDHKEIPGELKKVVVLSKTKKAKKKGEKAGKKATKHLTSREKRKLGLDGRSLPKTGAVKYNAFKNVHRLWLGYMREVLNFPALEKSVAASHDPSRAAEGRINAVLDEQLQLKIYRADMHGARVKVTRALNTALVGVQGFVVMETRNTLKIVDRNDVLRTVPKEGVSITLCVDGLVMTLAGSRMCMKPSDRAVKKWKNKPPFDL